MNREIKFRGKRLDNGEWVYGDFCHKFGEYGKLFPYISTELSSERIAPATLGQYTGRIDCNEVEIYEGDIVLCKGKYIYTVEWTTDSFVMRGKMYGGITSIPSFLRPERQVIGNIYDNPELLK